MAQGRVYKRGSTWTYRIDGPADPGSGRRRQISKGGFRTKREAETALTAARFEVDTGQHVRPTKLTVDEYLHGWLPSQEGILSPSTLKSYRNAATRITRHLGQVALQALTPDMVEWLHEVLADEELSAKTILNTHHVLQAALRDAQRRGLVHQNACVVARTPPNDRQVQPVLSAVELRVVLENIDDKDFRAIVHVVGHTGLRRGELVALRWGSVDLVKGTIAVTSSLTAVGGRLIEGSPKTKKSRRVIALDSQTVEVLRQHQDREKARRAALSQAPIDDADFVFQRPCGRCLNPDALSTRFRQLMNQLAEDHGITSITFHGLRHTHATHGLEAGVNPKAIADRLGHASVSTTLDRYSHITPATSAVVADRIADYVTTGIRSIDMKE